jgi:hypothetical protein
MCMVRLSLTHNSVPASCSVSSMAVEERNGPPGRFRTLHRNKAPGGAAVE